MKILAAKTAAALLLVGFAVSSTTFAHEVSAQAEVGGTANAGAGVDASIRIDASSSTSAQYEERSEMRERVADIKTGVVELREEAKEVRRSFAARVTALKAQMGFRDNERKVRLEVAAQGRIKGQLTAIENRFEAIAEHMGRISERLEARIAELEEGGYEMSESAELLAEADAKLSTAKKDIAEAKASLTTELAGETSKESLRVLVTAAKNSLKDTHDAYKDVIASIRAEATAKADAEAQVND